MSPRAILREAWRNIASGTARTAMFALLLTAVSAGLATADLLSVRAVTAAAERYQAVGASVVTLAAVGRVDGVACEALAGVPGVRAAGAIRAREVGIVAAALPSSAIPVMEVTAGLPVLLHATTAPNAGVILSDQAADALDLAAGDELVTHDGSTPVAGVYAYPTDGRRSGYGYAALVPVPAGGRFDECWVDVWPASPQTRTLLQTALAPGDEEAGPAVISQLNTTLGIAFDGAERFSERLTRYAAPLALILGAGLGFVSVRSRRMQLAAALHAGVRKPDLAAISGFELLSWVVPTALFTAATISVFIATGVAGDAAATALLGARIGALAAAGPFLGAALALALTRERHLFRYFKDR